MLVGVPVTWNFVKLQVLEEARSGAVLGQARHLWARLHGAANAEQAQVHVVVVEVVPTHSGIGHFVTQAIGGHL